MNEQGGDDDKGREITRNRDEDFCTINVPDSEKTVNDYEKPATLAIADEIHHQKTSSECHSHCLEIQLLNVVKNNDEENNNNCNSNNMNNIQRIFTPVSISIVNNGEIVGDDVAKIHQDMENQKVITSPLPLSPTVITGYANRSASAGSAKSAGCLSIGSISGDICRICHCESAPDAPLIAPCYCSGTLKYVHQKCLQQWIKSSQTRSCEVCRFSFIMQTKVKPFRKHGLMNLKSEQWQSIIGDYVRLRHCRSTGTVSHLLHNYYHLWEKLDIGTVERRKILCNVTFHIVVLICIVWSLYVLVERTADEIRDSTLEWPFWTKLVVMAIGFTGCIVLVYVQWRTYVRLFNRWRAYNRVIFVQNGPSSVRKGDAGAAPAAAAGGRQTTTNNRATATTVVEIK